MESFNGVVIRTPWTAAATEDSMKENAMKIKKDAWVKQNASKDPLPLADLYEDETPQHTPTPRNKPKRIWNGERCFSCDKPLLSDVDGLLNARHVWTRDGQNPIVGFECYKRASAMTIHGYQPPKGGPRIYTTMLPLCDHPEHQDKSIAKAEGRS